MVVGNAVFAADRVGVPMAPNSGDAALPIRQITQAVTGLNPSATNIAAGIVDKTGKIIAKDSVPTLNTRPIEAIMLDMTKLCKTLLDKSQMDINKIEAVGIGCPGTVDNKNGIISYSNNIPMKNVPMRKFMEKQLNISVNLENDANAAALGEYTANGHNASSYILITLGTGIGGGAVINSKIYRGFNGVGIEPGHMTLINGGERCTCGKHGCWETYGSVTALINQTKLKMTDNPDSLMHKISGKFGEVNGRVAFEAAKAGDKAGLEVVEKYTEYVADGITSVINIFEPEILVIGGGISKEGEYLLNPIRKFVEINEFNKYRPKTKIEIASLNNDAGIIGAALSANR